MGGDDRTSASACFGLKEGVILRRVDQSWSFDHREALKLTCRPIRPVKPLHDVARCVYPCAANQRKVKVSITWEALPATLTPGPGRP